MRILETERLNLRQLSTNDAEFIYELVNDPAWLQNIGDRGVRTLEDARRYILNGPVAMYQRVGFGLYCVEQKESGTPLGICGLIQRDGLDDVDIGFAFLPNYRGQGYAHEAAAATLAYAKTTLQLKRIIAIVLPGNHSSIKLLEKLGLTFEKMIRLPHGTEDLKLYALDLH